MASRFAAIALAVSMSIGWAADTARAARQTTPLADGWRFAREDAGPAAATAGWDAVTVPHTWNNLDAQKGVAGNPGVPGGYFRGACWYARPLDVPADLKGRRVFVRFEAASIVAQVYLNGELIGEHRGAFTAFCFELTPHLRPGQANELRVRVDNSFQPDVPPIAGDFNMDGGIYRPVALIVTDDVCVTPLDSASPGVYVSTRSLDDHKASVEVKSLVSNGDSAQQSPQVETEIRDAAGAVVAHGAQAVTVAAGATAASTQTLEIADPHRWDGRNDPYLYSVVVRVRRGDQTVDEVTQPLGLRTVSIAPDRGFLLNGKPYPIHGVNRHQDKFDQGWALSADDHRQDAEAILAMGATAVRDTHYPQSGTWHDLADHNGLLLWDEVSLVDTIRDTPEFTANSEAEAREMVCQLYNHPSICFWGIFNELGNKPLPPGGADVTLLTKLKADIKALDDSRLIVAASDHLAKPYNLIPDWACYNQYPGWYGSTPSQFGPTVRKFAQEVGHPIALSEYGAGGNPFQHQEGPLAWVGGKIAKAPFHPEEYQAAVHEADYAQIVDNPDVWGSFLWVMFDFPAAPRKEGGTVGLNDKGMVTQDRKVKKDVYFFYQANWAREPMVHIAAARMTPRTMPQTEVKVYSNCDAVELKVNGRTLPAATPDKVHVFRWADVALQPGENQIEATGTAAGKTVADRCAWVLQPQATTTTAP